MRTSGTGVVFAATDCLAALFQVDLDATVPALIEGDLWPILFLLFIPVSILVNMVPIAWLCGLVLVQIGCMEPKDLKHFALRSRFPGHWFKEAAENPLNERTQDAA